jgi:hypothetical protein
VPKIIQIIPFFRRTGEESIQYPHCRELSTCETSEKMIMNHPFERILIHDGGSYEEPQEVETQYRRV